MSFEACIDNSDITPEQKSETKQLFRQLEAHYNTQMNASAARSKAASETIARLKQASAERKRQLVKQIAAQAKMTMRLQNYTKGKRENIYSGAVSFFDYDARANDLNVEQLKNVIRGQAFSRMNDVLVSFRRNFIGTTRNKASQKDMLNEAFGKDTGKTSAKQLAQAWYEATEYLRKRANAAGSQIGKLVDPKTGQNIWGLPTRHDPISVNEVTYEEWSKFIIPLLDLDKMTDRKTNLPFKALVNTDSEGRVDIKTSMNLDAALRETYETIISNGTNKQKKGQYRGSGAIGKKYNHHRFLIFQDGDKWAEYNTRFGRGEPYDIMMGHIDNMSRDIALMEIFGPSPNAGVRYLEDLISEETTKISKGKSRKEQKRIDKTKTKTLNKVSTLYDWVSDKNQTPADQDFAFYMEGVRNVIHSSFLGSTSVLAAYTDMNFQRIARDFSGLPQTKVLGDYLKLLNPLKAKDRTQTAVRLGLIAETWVQMAAGQARYVGEVNGPEITRRVAEMTMRASLLSPWTQAGRMAFGMEFLGSLADDVGKTFDELNPKMQSMMQSYKISADKWDIIRSTDLLEEEGATFISARNIEDRADINPELAREIATNVLRMVQSETDYAVPTSSTRAKSTLVGDTKPGTIQGEFARSFAMYKNFGVTLLNTHLARGWTKNTLAGKAGYLGGFLITSTIMAALAIQTKEIAKGRDPLPMVGDGSVKFWSAALLASGGLSIYADFVFSQDPTGRSGLAETVAGPAVGFGGDVLNLTVGNIVQAAQGKDTRIASETVKFIQRYMPGQSIWYWRTAIERNLFDQLRLWSDDKTHSDFRRLRSKRARDFNQSYWWDLGSRGPTRAPDFSKIIGK